jgi:NADPH2:quinone reductase
MGIVKSAPKGAPVKAGDRVSGMHQGGFAQRIAVPFKALVPVPDNMPSEEAAGELLRR